MYHVLCHYSFTTELLKAEIMSKQLTQKYSWDVIKKFLMVYDMQKHLGPWVILEYLTFLIFTCVTFTIFTDSLLIIIYLISSME